MQGYTKKLDQMIQINTPRSMYMSNSDQKNLFSSCNGDCSRKIANGLKEIEECRLC